MNVKAQRILIFFALILVSLTLLFWGLVQAQSFLMPLSIAVLLAMIVLPVSNWLERKGVSRGWASFLSDLVIVVFIIGLAGVLAAQAKSLASDWPQIKQKIEPRIEQLQQFITQRTGLSVQEQNQKISLPDFSSGAQRDSTQTKASPPEKATSGSGSPSGGAGSILSSVGKVVGGFFGGLGTLLLILIYTFFFLLYRRKFLLSILRMVPHDRQDQARKTIADATRVSQNYLSGRLLLILFLAVLYAVGLTISGVRNAILISLLAAVLSLLPYIGNVIGYALAVLVAFVSGGGAGAVMGVSITFAVAQFVESYVLEPYVVGDKVNLNPVFTIVVVVLGEAVWGIAGMLIAIPVLGILKAVFDHVPPMQPLGYLFGQEDTKDDDGQHDDTILDKTKQWAMNKFRS